MPAFESAGAMNDYFDAVEAGCFDYSHGFSVKVSGVFVQREECRSLSTLSHYDQESRVALFRSLYEHQAIPEFVE